MRKQAAKAAILVVSFLGIYQVAEANSPPPIPNYAGKNICLAVSPWAPGASAGATTIVKSEWGVGTDKATHTATLSSVGSVSITEAKVPEDRCANLPRDEFWILHRGGKSSAAFCLTGIRPKEHILVNISYAPHGKSKIGAIEQLLFSVSACGMIKFSTLYVGNDTFKAGRIIMGYRKSLE